MCLCATQSGTWAAEPITGQRVSGWPEYGPEFRSGYWSEVAVAGDRAYGAAGPSGLVILDVKNPAEVRPLGAFKTRGLASGVQVQQNRAYVAEGQDGLEVLDVSDPAHVRRLGSFDTTGSARRVHVVGTVAFVADDRDGLLILEVSDPAQVRRLGGFAITGARGVHVVRNTAYVADGDLQILDVSDPANVRRLGGFQSADPFSSVNDVQVVGNFAYLAERQTKTLRTFAGSVEVLDVSDPTNVRRLGGLNTSGWGNRVQVVGNRAYVANEGAGLQVLDVADPASVRRLGGFDTTNAHGMQVIGTLAFVADGIGGLQVLDVSDPANAQRLGAYDTRAWGEATAIQVVGDLAFVAVGHSGIQVIRLAGGPGFAPGILGQPQSQEAKLGATIMLQVSAAGTEPLRYRWRKDGVELADGARLTGSASPALTIKGLEAADLGTFSVEVSNQVGKVTSTPATVSLEPFRLQLSTSDLFPAQSKLRLRISGATVGETVVVQSSTDLLNWVRLQTNVVSASAMAIEVPWTGTESKQFFRATQRR